jgi:hypothetical protein
VSNVCSARDQLPKLEDLFRDYAATVERNRAAATKDLYVKGAKDDTAVHPSDVVQGQHADCFLMAAMSAVTQQHPDPDAWMKDRIKVNDNGTYTVTFYDKQPDGTYKPHPVTVNGEFSKAAHSDEKGEKWPSVMEKAYATAYGRADDKPYGFGRDGGISGQAMDRLTGTPSAYLPMSTMTVHQLANYQQQGYAITMPTHTEGPGPVTGLPLPGYEGKEEFGQKLGQWHVYYVNAVDPGTGMVVVHNVWDEGRQELYVPFEQFQQSFNGVQINQVVAR